MGIITMYNSCINLRGSEKELITNATKSKKLMKVAMAIGLLGLLLASLTPFSQITNLLA